MTLRASVIALAAFLFAISPFFSTFDGFNPSLYPIPQDDPPVQPAGYAFSIWGVIYIWLLIMAGVGLVLRRDDPDWDATRLPLIVSLGVGVTWLPVAQVSPLWATLLIWIMLVAALVAVLRSPASDAWVLAMPVGLYAGWLTAASSVSIGLTAAGWGLWPFGQLGWTYTALGVAFALAAFILWRRPVWTYGFAVAWALVAVVVQNGASSGVGMTAAIGAILIAVFTVIQVVRTRA